MPLNAIATHAFEIAIFALLVSIGLRTRPADALHIVRHWPKGLRALAALFVVPPAAMLVLCLVLSLPPAVEVALIALSVSPMLPVLPNDLAKLGADHRYCISLEIVGAATALVAAPIVFWIVSQVMHIDIDIGVERLLASLAQGVLFPLALGTLFAVIFPALAERVTTPVVAIASLVLMIAAMIILWHARDLILAQLNVPIVASILLLILVGLSVGHLLGGPDPGERAALALTAASRHPGFAIAVGVAVAPKAGPTVIGVVLVYFLARGLTVLPYMRAAKRAHHAAPPLSTANADSAPRSMT